MTVFGGEPPMVRAIQSAPRGPGFTIDGDRYQAVGPFEMEMTGDGTMVFPLYESGARWQRVVDPCETCGRGTLVDHVMTLDEAIASGFFIRLESA